VKRKTRFRCKRSSPHHGVEKMKNYDIRRYGGLSFLICTCHACSALSSDMGLISTLFTVIVAILGLIGIDNAVTLATMEQLCYNIESSQNQIPRAGVMRMTEHGHRCL
jgi:hypothetical protein